jgi:NTE family protein
MNLLKLFLPFRPESDDDRSDSTGTYTLKSRRAVVALGGGGARGISHLGVMQAIGDAGVRTERIVGVSMGSLVGAMCAATPDIRLVQAKAIELLHSPIFQLKQEILFGAKRPSESESTGSLTSWYGRLRSYLSAHKKLTRAVTSPSLISATPLIESIEYLLPDIDIQELPTPLSIVTLDLLTGQRIVIEKGSLRKAVLASASIPGIFPPVVWDNMLLADLGVLESVPTMIARSYASDLTIGVDVAQDRRRVQGCKTALETMMRVDDICEQLMRRHLLDAADLIVRPNVGNVAWFDFSEPERLINEGRNAGQEAVEQFQKNQAA